MNNREFLGLALPQAGHYCLFHKADGYPRHEWFDSIDDLAGACEAHEATTDLYFGTAAFAAPTERTQANVLALRCLRLDIDAGEKKFAKDPEGTYPTQRDAVAALAEAFKAGLPKASLALSSGEGVHAYWFLDRDLNREEWDKLAGALHFASKAVGLKADPKVTRDSARVLRPIGSLHNNGTLVGAALLKVITPEPYSPAALGTLLDEATPDESKFELAAEMSKLAAKLNADILEIKTQPASIAKVADHCQAIAWVRDTKGNVPEPVWRSFMGVAKYCEDGQDFIHPWSEGDPRYDAKETQAKFDRWETPPATCASFQPYGKCAGCKHAGKITTPKQLGYIEVREELEAPPETTATWTLPDELDVDEEPAAVEPTESASGCPIPGREDLFDPTKQLNPFFYKKTDGRWVLYVREVKKEKDGTGVEVQTEFILPVISKLVWIGYVTDTGASENGGAMSVLCRMDRIGQKRFATAALPGDISSQRDTLLKFMSNQGVYLHPNNKKAGEHLHNFIIHELHHVQDNMKFVVRNRFGYHMHDGQMLCSQGELTVFPRGHKDGEIQRCIVSSNIKEMAPAFGVNCLPPSVGRTWGQEVWRDHVAPSTVEYIKFVRKHYGHDGFEVARLALAIPLASPMLVFCADAPMTEDPELPTCGLVVSMFSQGSGRGKSAIQEVLAAGYGRPSLKRSGTKESATLNSIREMAHASAVYPFILDEVTRNSAADAAALLDMFSNGQGRTRLTSSAQIKGSASTWALITSVSTNVPQRELLASAQKSSNALSNRLLELDFDALQPSGSHVEFTNDFKALTPHFGAFGLLVAYLAVNKGREAMTAIGQENVGRAYDYLNCPQEFRFFARGLAAVLTLSDLLGRHFPFDIDEIKASYKKAVDAAMQAGKNWEVDAATEVSAMLSSLAPNIAITPSWTRRGNDLLLNQPRMPLYGREVQNEGIVIVDSTKVKQWCVENQISCRAFLERAYTAGLLVSKTGKVETGKVRLNTGVKSLPTQNINSYTFRTRADGGGESDHDE